MSDTPISNSTPHNVAELGMLCRRLERELNADNDMFKKLNIHALNLADRVKRLEEESQQLEKDSKRLAWLLKTGLAWRGCYNEHWIEGEWLYLSQYAIATIDKAKEDKP